jgi:16S rRNA (guanine1207-N2)-methyltransferase
VSDPLAASRLLAAHLDSPAAPVQGATVVFLQPTDATPVLAARTAGARVHVAHRKLPAVQAIRDALAQAGFDARGVRHGHGRLGLAAGVVADHVVVTLPEERVAGQQLLLDAARLLRDGGRLLLAGANDGGIRPAARLVAEVFGEAHTLAHGGGHRVLEAIRTAACDVAPLTALVAPYDDPEVYRQLAVTVAGAPTRLFTRPGVFSWDHLDEASAILADVMTPHEGEDVLDLGCGAGALGAAVVHTAPTARLMLVDADSEAVRCAARTMAATGHEAWSVRASDVGRAIAEARFDLVVCNPPFHTGPAVDLALPRRFLEAAHALLRPGGRLQLVANRTLPYEGELERVFGNRRTMHDGRRFKVLEAVRR